MKRRGESGGPAPSAGLFNRAADRRADRLQAGSETAVSCRFAVVTED